MSIYEQLGGQSAIKSTVTVFYNRVLEDETLEQWFAGVDLNRLRAHQRAFLTAALGGPAIFAGKEPGEAHAGMGITDAAFTSVVDHLLVTLRDLDTAEPLITEVAQRLEGLRSSIVTA